MSRRYERPHLLGEELQPLIVLVATHDNQFLDAGLR